MAYKKQNNKQHSRKAVLLGDIDLLTSIRLTQKDAIEFGHSKQLAKFLIIGRIIKFFRALLGLSIGLVFRTKFGNKTLGVLALFLILSYCICWNTTQIHWLAKPLIWILSPVLIWFEYDRVIDMTLVNVHSRAMMVYILILAVSGLVNIVLSWTKYGRQDRTKRGESYLGMLIPKNWNVSEFVVRGAEAVIGMAVGALFYCKLNDPVFGLYLMSASFSLLCLEAIDYASLRKAFDDAD